MTTSEESIFIPRARGANASRLCRFLGLSLLLAFGAASCQGSVSQGEPDDAEDPRTGGDDKNDGEGGGIDDLPPEERPNVDVEGRCAVSDPMPAAQVPMRRLTRSQVQDTVKDVLGVSESLPVGDETLLTFRSNISSAVDGTALQGYFDFAERVSERVSYTRCATAASCKAWVIDDIGRRLFRRALQGEMRTRYEALFDQGASQDGTAIDGAKWALQAMLQSPRFLYLDEPANTDGFLDGHAVAARLALALWGRNPDAALLDAAESGDLDDAAGVRERVSAMLADPRSRSGLGAFAAQWLELERLHNGDSRPDLKALGEPTIAAMETEPGEVFRMAILGDGGLPELLTEARTIDGSAMTSVYGADVISRDGTEARLDPARRAGLLTLPGVMAALSHAGMTSPTLRGRAMLTNVLCAPPPPPPADVDVTLPPPRPGATTRERLEDHFSSAACAPCHRLIDGLGFAFERFDTVGRTRDLDGGKPIDDRAQFDLGQGPIEVTGAIELSQALAEREQVSQCLAGQWIAYATGVPVRAEVECLVNTLGDGLGRAGGLQAMILDVATSEYLRKGVTP